MSDSEKELRAAVVEARDYHPNLGVFELTSNCAFEIIGELDRLRTRISELEGTQAKDAAELSDLREVADNARAAIVEVFGADAPLWSPADAIRSLGRWRKEQAAELERLHIENNEISDQLITNGQRLGSVCDNWHNWAVEIVGKEATRKMSGQDMRGEISLRLSELERLRTSIAKVRAIRASWTGTNQALDLELGEALGVAPAQAVAQAEAQSPSVVVTEHPEMPTGARGQVFTTVTIGAAQPSGECRPCTGAEFIEAAQKAIEPRTDEEIRDAIVTVEGDTAQPSGEGEDR